MKKSTYDQLSLEDELLRECEAMAKYAFTSGTKVPAAVVQKLDSLADKLWASRERSTQRNTDVSNSEQPEKVDKTTGEDQRDNIAKELSVVHASLAKIVAPATPRTLLLFATETAKGGFWLFLGLVPLVRHLILVALLSLIALITISLAPSVDGHVDWNTESGIQLLLEQLFLIAAAAIGASFIALFEANRFITDGTYDPKYDTSYWIRLVLGIIAGMILALLIPMGKVDATTGEMDGPLGQLTKPTLAMLGGFSATVVYRILRRLVDTVESLVRGETRTLIAAQEQETRARFAEQSAQNRIQLASRLTKLQQQINENATPDKLRAEINRILGNLVPLDEEEGEETNVSSQNSQDEKG